jgi:hypothetical protein
VTLEGLCNVEVECRAEREYARREASRVIVDRLIRGDRSPQWGR